jgi:thiol-disulfide isomerase/thioredoxin
MKIRFLLLFSFLFFSNCSNPNSEKINYIFNEGPVIIAGQLENYTDKTVVLTLLELTGRVDHVAKIDSSGSFRFDVQILSSHDNYLNVGGNTSTVFLEANDSVFLDADASRFQHSVVYSGDNCQFNQALNSFFIEFIDKLETSEFLLKKRDLGPDTFKEFAAVFFTELKDASDSISNSYELNMQESSWLNNFVKYRYAEDLLEYGFHHEEDLPDNYYSFEQEFLNEDNYAIQCSQYYEDFIEKYYISTILSRKDGFDEMINKYTQQTKEGLKGAIAFMDQYLSNTVVKDIAVTQVCYSLVGSEPLAVDSILDYYSTVVTDITCQNFIAKQIDEQLTKESKYMDIGELTELEYVGSIFEEIQESNAGKVLYIDFWGTWCGGCLGAFPYSNELYKSLEKLPVEFIYLCINSNKEAWQNTIKKYNLEGKHYLLSRDQSAMLLEVFSFNGVPRYMLVNRNGRFVDYNAKDPYSKVLKEDILSLI